MGAGWTLTPSPQVKGGGGGRMNPDGWGPWTYGCLFFKGTGADEGQVGAPPGSLTLAGTP